MSALRWALEHPANAGRQWWVVRRWCMHQLRKRLLPHVPVRVTVGAGILVGPPRHPSICLTRYVRGGLVDLDAFAVYAALLGPGDVFLDVGANIGLHSVFVASLVRGGRLVACEPDARCWPWLRRNLADTGVPWQLETRPLADRPRSAGWVQGPETLSHLAGGAGHGSAVETTTVDAVIGRLGLDPRSVVVKVDVEGWESAVIVGARAALDGGLRAMWVEATELQGRCDVPWRRAVEACEDRGMQFWLVDVRRRWVSEIRSPEPRSPTGHYLISTPEGARRVASTVGRWPELLTRTSRPELPVR